jgi:hypothetical protein
VKKKFAETIEERKRHQRLQETKLSGGNGSKAVGRSVKSGPGRYRRTSPKSRNRVTFRIKISQTFCVTSDTVAFLDLLESFEKIPISCRMASAGKMIPKTSQGLLVPYSPKFN